MRQDTASRTEWSWVVAIAWVSDVYLMFICNPIWCSRYCRASSEAAEEVRSVLPLTIRNRLPAT